MILSTTYDLPHRGVTKILGLVKGNTIRARHVGHDIMAQMKNLVGGEISDYTKMMAETREQAIDRMIADAVKLDADAIVGIQFSTSYIMTGAAELLVYGTAVKIAPEE